MTTDAPNVTVVIPAHNAAGYLRESVGSALASEGVDVTVVVVDDGSTDETAAVAQQIADGGASVRVITQGNAGPSAARNTALGAVPGGEFVFFLDADDRLTPGALTRLAGFLRAHPDTVAVGGQYAEFDAAGTRQARRTRYVPAWPLPRDLRDDETRTPFVSFLAQTGNGPFYLWRQSALDRVGAWDETLWSHEDADMLCRAALAGPVHFLPDVVLHKRVVAGSLTSVGQERGGGARFRAKWYDPESLAWLARGADVDAGAALRYVLGVHEPLRDLKVAVKKARRVVSHREVAKAHPVPALVSHAVGSAVRAAVSRPAR